MSRVRAAVVIAGEFIAFAPIVEAGCIDFARPKSSYFNRAVTSHLDVRGLQIPMDDPMPVRHFERVRELLRAQERLRVTSIEVSEQSRTQGGKKVKRNEYFKKLKPRLEARMLSRSFRAVQTFDLVFSSP